MSNAWMAHKEYSTPLALRAIRWIALRLGRPAARALLYPITLYYLLFAVKQRRASRLYLKRVLKRKPTWLDSARHIHYFASTVLDRVYLVTRRFDRLAIEFPRENLPLKYFQAGKSCLLLGSHVGSFEVLRSYALKKSPLPIKILMHEGQTPMVMQALHALNPALAETVIPMYGSENSLLKVKDALDAGYAVGLLGDRVSGEESEKTVDCRFLGGQIKLPVVPVVLASALKVPLILFFGFYNGANRYQIHFELLAEEIVLSRKNRQRDIACWMQRYADILERHVREKPYNWFNFYDYWQEDER